MKSYYVYIISNWTSEVLYIGITNDLERRLSEHSNKIIKGFSSKYNLNKLVYYEEYSDVSQAIEREKQLKKWGRQKKNWLIETPNPTWKNLANG